MKYKGIKLKAITTPQVFDPPKQMFVWDNDVKCGVPLVQTVYAVIRTVNGTTQVVGAGSLRWSHCAEIPKPRRATNRELAKWLAQGNGEKYEDEWTFHVHPYLTAEANIEVIDKIKVRKWEDTEWHEPTVDYMGIEANLAFAPNMTAEWIDGELLPKAYSDPDYFRETEVKIGNQIWMNKNLDLTDGGEGIYFNKDNGEYYYTWDAAKRIADKIPGWHLPSREEWNELVEAVGNDAANLRIESWKGTNKYGFSAVPAGHWHNKFYTVGVIADFWTSEPYGSYARCRGIDSIDVYESNSYKDSGFSVRLVKDK